MRCVSADHTHIHMCVGRRDQDGAREYAMFRRTIHTHTHTLTHTHIHTHTHTYTHTHTHAHT